MTRIETVKKKTRPGVVECSLFDICFSFDVGRSMSESSLTWTFIFQNNLALMASQFRVRGVDFSSDLP